MRVVIRCDPGDHQINCVCLRGLCPPSSQFKVLIGTSEGSVTVPPAGGQPGPWVGMMLAEEGLAMSCTKYS